MNGLLFIICMLLVFEMLIQLRILMNLGYFLKKVIPMPSVESKIIVEEVNLENESCILPETKIISAAESKKESEKNYKVDNLEEIIKSINENIGRMTKSGYNGTYQVTNLADEDINTLKSLLDSQGYKVEIDERGFANRVCINIEW